MDAPASSSRADASRRRSDSADPSAAVSMRQLERLRQAFIHFDTNHSGTLDRDEFKYAVRKLKIDMNDEGAEELFEAVDENSDGVIDFEEYMGLMTNLLLEANKEDEAQSIFKILCDKRTGKISLRTLRRFCRDMKLPLSEAELDEMFIEADLNGDGLIDRQEFNLVMRTCGLV